MASFNQLSVDGFNEFDGRFEPYLTPEQVTDLSQTLFAQNHFQYWITDYISPAAYKYFRSPKRMKQMKNAPFLFYPTDWFGFFEKMGWKLEKIE